MGWHGETPQQWQARTNLIAEQAEEIATLEAQLAEAIAECKMLREHIQDIETALETKQGCGGSIPEDIIELKAQLAEARADFATEKLYNEDLTCQLDAAQKESELHKAFHDLVVKERDLARYQVAKLTAAAIDTAREG